MENYDPMEEFGHELNHLLADLQGESMFDFGWGSITPFSVWAVITAIVVFALAWYLRTHITFIPKFGLAAALEAVVDYIKREVGENLLGAHASEHLPYLLTLFSFVLLGNLIGLIPGAKSATGTMSVNLVLSGSSFLYFNYAGMRHYGPLKYIASIAPAGVPPGLNVLVWLIEVFSMSMRMFSLAIRLFANMFAGHLTMGVFAILASVYFLPLMHGITVAALGSGALSAAWVFILTCIYAAEILVAFIQSYVFTLLSAVYVQLSTSAH